MFKRVNTNKLNIDFCQKKKNEAKEEEKKKRVAGKSNVKLEKSIEHVDMLKRCQTHVNAQTHTDSKRSHALTTLKSRCKNTHE